MLFSLLESSEKFDAYSSLDAWSAWWPDPGLICWCPSRLGVSPFRPKHGPVLTTGRNPVAFPFPSSAAAAASIMVEEEVGEEVVERDRVGAAVPPGDAAWMTAG